MHNHADHYAQWIRSVMTHATDKQHILIGSSFDEPLELLEQTVKNGFCNGFPDTYKSVFVNGNPLVVDLLSKHYRVPPEQVLCTTGATTSMAILYRTFTKPGDHILIENPALDVFRILADERDLDVGIVNRSAEMNFAVDLEHLKSQITDKTRLLVLSNLHNPSGALLSDAEIKDIAEVAAAHNCLVIMDEVYIGYAESSSVSVTAAHLADNIISINSLTKTHGLNSLRCGWIIASPEYMEPIRRYNDLHEYGVSKLAHSVAGLVLQEQEIYRAHRQKAMSAVKPLMDFHLQELINEGLINDFLPQYGCMYFPVLKGIENSKEFTAWLLEKKNVLIAPGEYFGMSGAIRVGVPEKNEHLGIAFDRLATGIREYTDLVYRGDKSKRAGG